MKTKDQKPMFINLSEVARRLGWSRTAVYNGLKQGHLPPPVFNRNRRCLFRPEDYEQSNLEAWFAKISAQIGH